MRWAWLLVLAGCSSAAPAAPTPTWMRIASPTTEDLCLITFLNDRQGWIAAESGTVLGTVDGGLSWSLLSGPKTDKKNRFNCEHLVFRDAQRGRMGICCGWCGTGGNWLMEALETADGGRTWTPLDREAAEKSDLTQSRIFESLSGESWQYGHQHSVYVAIAGRWSLIESLGPGCSSRHYSDVWFNSPQSGCILGIDNEVFHTADGGLTWRRKGAEALSGRHLRHVRMTSDTSITVSGDTSIYASLDAGGSWFEEWSGVESEKILRLEFLPSKVGFAVGKGGLILRRNPSGL